MGLQAATQSVDLPHRARSEGSLASYVSDSDYPADALAQGAEGTVAFRLVVSPEGRVIDCKIEQSSGTSSLDAQTCAVMTSRARFLPARDRSGRAVIDTMRSRIRWVLGTPLPPGIAFFAPGRVAAILAVEENNELHCSVEVNGTQMPASAPCPQLSKPILEAAQHVPALAQLVLVQSFMPDGGIIAAPAIPYGQLLAESTAEIIVDEQGAITDCHSISRTVLVPGSPTPPDVCSAQPLPRFDSGAPNRHARVTISLYLGSRTRS